MNLATLLYRFMTYCGYFSAEDFIVCSVRSPQFEVKWHNRVTSSKASHRVSQSVLTHKKERPYYNTPEVWCGLTKHNVSVASSLTINCRIYQVWPCLPNKELWECSRDMLNLTQINNYVFQALSCNFTAPDNQNLTKYGFLWKKWHRKKFNLKNDVEVL